MPHYRYVIHNLADDLARVHVDQAGRKHHFWVWGDIPVIARRYAAYRAKDRREARWETDFKARNESQQDEGGPDSVSQPEEQQEDWAMIPF
jgi:hypothetical protein